MLKKLCFLLLLVASSTWALGAEFSNNYFSISLPDNLKDIYMVEKEKDGIYVLEKTSYKEGIGGFAFGVKIFKSPSDYFDMPNVRKLGELKAKNGVLYDMVLERPSEIQYGEGEEVAKKYNTIYELGDNVEIKAVKGNSYFKDQGAKGESNYKNVIKKYIKAISENWSAEKYEKEGLGYIYPLLAEENNDLLNKVGYAYYDLNSDGIEELFIGGFINRNSLFLMFIQW